MSLMQPTYFSSKLTDTLISCQLYLTTELPGPHPVWTQLTGTHWCSNGPMDIPLGPGNMKYSGGHNGLHHYKSPRLQYHSLLYCISTHYKNSTSGQHQQTRCKLCLWLHYLMEYLIFTRPLVVIGSFISAVRLENHKYGSACLILLSALQS